MTGETLDNRLRRHVCRLAGEIGEHNVFHPDALHAAQAYITQTWHTQGYEVAEQGFAVQGVHCANLAIERPGVARPAEIILIGAHYDSVIGAPGANDNGSGVAALLEISRLLLTATPPCTFRLVAFANEEMPFFNTAYQGSARYARAARQREDDIRLMLSLETIGYYRDEPNSQCYPRLYRFFYPDRGNFIALVSNFRSRPQMLKLASHFRACSDFPLEHVATFTFVPGVAWSDHAAFWQWGYRALMVTDTAFYRYPYYHTAEDTPEKLDYVSLARVTAGLFCAICSLAEEGAYSERG